MDPRKVSAEWFRSTVFKDQAIRPRPARNSEHLPSMLLTARSLENNAYQSWQSRESVFMKQAKLLAHYDEEDYDGDCGDVAGYYPTYQSLTDRQLRCYFAWRTRLRRGDVRDAPLTFAFLYLYELINQIGVEDPLDGYRRLERFRDTYGQLNTAVLSYLALWRVDYVVYYGLDPELLSDTPQVRLDRCVTVLEQVQEQDPAAVMNAVKQLAPKRLERSRFYGEYPQDMDRVIVRVLRRVSDHYAARCKKSMVEQYFGSFRQCQVRLFDAAIFCDPLKRRSCTCTVDEQRSYICKNGLWYARARAGSSRSGANLDGLLKTIDSIMRREYEYRHPVKAVVEAKWIVRLIQEEVQALLAEKRAGEEKKITIDYAQLTRIRRDAAATREKLIVDEEAGLSGEGWDMPTEEGSEPVEPLFQAQAQVRPVLEPQPAPAVRPAPAPEPAPAEALPLSPAERRLLHCLLYGGDLGWVQVEGQLLSVLVDGVNEKLYDVFLDCVLDDRPQLIEDYIDDLKEMVHP